MVRPKLRYGREDSHSSQGYPLMVLVPLPATLTAPGYAQDQHGVSLRATVAWTPALRG